jgi:hypothetical protein
MKNCVRAPSAIPTDRYTCERRQWCSYRSRLWIYRRYRVASRGAQTSDRGRKLDMSERVGGESTRVFGMPVLAVACVAARILANMKMITSATKGHRRLAVTFDGNWNFLRSLCDAKRRETPREIRRGARDVLSELNSYDSPPPPPASKTSCSRTRNLGSRRDPSPRDPSRSLLLSRENSLNRSFRSRREFIKRVKSGKRRVKQPAPKAGRALIYFD